MPDLVTNSARMKPPLVTAEGTFFRLWAPKVDEVTLKLVSRGAEMTVEQVSAGQFEVFVPGVGHGDTYQYEIAGKLLPDPTSAYQPAGVNGPSMVVDQTSYRWQDDGWRGVEWRDLITYELHLGCFTRAGTYRAAIDRLNEVVDLGATAIELMPLAECPGDWNWGYDGVYLFAPSHNYGTPDELRELVDACHARGLAVIHDVVYNHFGPEGNHLGELAPFFHRKPSPWGDSPDFRRSEVREFYHANALYWIEDFHFDGLRLDAIAAIRDDSDLHIINEIGNALRAAGERLGRAIHAIGESNLYQPEFLPAGGGSLHGLWSDDIGHAIMSTVEGEKLYGGREYAGFDEMLSALRHGYLYRRQDGGAVRARSQSTADLDAIVHQIQNHDIVGNHPHGERLHQPLSPQVQRALAPLCLLYPGVPMLFMGEEFCANSPFLFFVDFQCPQLRRAVERGRANDFDHHDWDEAIAPTDPRAFEFSKLPSLDSGDTTTLQWYRELIRLRRDWLQSGLLAAANFAIDGDRESQLIRMSYHQDELLATVAVTLNAPRPVELAAAEPECTLSSGEVTYGHEAITLGKFAAAVSVS